jgi:hypothetical protein
MENKDLTLLMPPSITIDNYVGEVMKPLTEVEKEMLLQWRLFDAWAPPIAWGPWYHIAAHGGILTYTIEFEQTGDTMVKGQVQYYNNGQKIQTLFSGDSITTGNVWANVYVRFYGNPLGSHVRVRIKP